VMGPPRREVSGAVDADAATDETVERAISLYCILLVVLLNGIVGVDGLFVLEWGVLLSSVMEHRQFTS
jgi:hypothetical protein